MSQLPAALHSAVVEAIGSLGDRSPIRSVRPLGGGCINHATRLETARERYFLKWNPNPLPGMFTLEASGLELLASTNTVRVPRVFCAAEAVRERPAFMLQEWLEEGLDNDLGALGEKLADLHRSSSSLPQAGWYGLEQDNYIGSTPQINTREADWAEFFINCRILPQVELAVERGRMTQERSRRANQLVSKISTILGGVSRQPALIHGDLWIGNVHGSPDGMAVIDPAVSFSDREAEIAFTELFGGFSARFYQAYNAAWPLAPGYSERRDLYNLYHLFNHLNLFGESYGYQVDAILRRYT